MENLNDLLTGRDAAQHFFAAIDDNRDVPGLHLKTIEQILDVGILVQIDRRVRMSVSCEKLANPQRARADGLQLRRARSRPRHWPGLCCRF